MPGPRPTPTAVLKSRGSPRAARRAAEPAPLSAVPKPPATLSKVGAEEWRRMGAMLLERGLLTATDVDALTLYIDAFERWTEARAQVARDGLIVKSPNGYPVQHPALAILNRAWEQMKWGLIEFGLTPAARTRVNVTPKAAPKPAGDNKARFFPAGPALRIVK